MKITTPEQLIATLLNPSKHWLQAFDDTIKNMTSSDKLHCMLHQSQLRLMITRFNKKPFSITSCNRDQRKAIAYITHDASTACINFLTKKHVKPHHLSILMPLAETFQQQKTHTIDNGIESYLFNAVLSAVHAAIKNDLTKLTLDEMIACSREIKDKNIKLTTLSLYYHLV